MILKNEIESDRGIFQFFDGYEAISSG